MSIGTVTYFNTPLTYISTLLRVSNVVHAYLRRIVKVKSLETLCRPFHFFFFFFTGALRTFGTVGKDYLNSERHEEGSVCRRPYQRRRYPDFQNTVLSLYIKINSPNWSLTHSWKDESKLITKTVIRSFSLK